MRIEDCHSERVACRSERNMGDLPDSVDFLKNGNMLSDEDLHSEE